MEGRLVVSHNGHAAIPGAVSEPAPERTECQEGPAVIKSPSPSVLYIARPSTDRRVYREGMRDLRAEPRVPSLLESWEEALDAILEMRTIPYGKSVPIETVIKNGGYSRRTVERRIEECRESVKTERDKNTGCVKKIIITCQNAHLFYRAAHKQRKTSKEDLPLEAISQEVVRKRVPDENFFEANKYLLDEEVIDQQGQKGFAAHRVGMYITKYERVKAGKSIANE